MCDRGKNAQGASTLSMQLARDMFLTPERNWRRKLAEIMITMQLEQKLTKEQIFEMYCNQVDLGYRGSFTIRGFGEAAQAYFGKDHPFAQPARSRHARRHRARRQLLQPLSPSGPRARTPQRHSRPDAAERIHRRPRIRRRRRKRRSSWSPVPPNRATRPTSSIC